MTKLQKSADGGKCDMLKTGTFEILCVVKYDFGHSIQRERGLQPRPFSG